MATIHFPSLPDAEVVEVEFLKPGGSTRSMRLLVDSGFVGQSCFVLAEDAAELRRAELPPTQAMGALQGMQNRAWVTCRILALSFQRTLIAIVGDISSLSLPAGVEGMVGLRFLRQFGRWGAEQVGDSGWQFFLADGDK